MNQFPTTEPPAISPLSDLADLKRKSVRGGMITFVSQGASVGIQLASTVTLARLLSPDDYGIIAMVASVTAFAGLFRDLGLSTAAIQKEKLTNAQQSNLFWINVTLGAVLTLLLAVASPLVASFYQKPRVMWVAVALSFSFLIGSLAAQSDALLIREMRFGRQAVAGLFGALASLSASLILALCGFRYWSLVWGQLAGTLTTTLLLFFLSPFRPGLPRRRTGVREMLRFGAHVTAFDFVNYFHRNLDNILIGRFWGAGPLGLYSRGYSLLMFPIVNLRGPINAVAFPALSRLQNQPEAFRSYYRRVTFLLAFLSMPLTAFLFVASRPIIGLLLGNNWLSVVPIFSWLAIAGFAQPASGLAGSVLLSLGNGRRYLHCGIFNTLVFVTSFVVGLPWGPVGVAASYAVANYILLYPWLTWAFRGSPVSFRDFVDVCSLPFTLSAIFVALGCVVRPLVSNLSPVGQILALAAILLTVVSCGAFLTRSGRQQLKLVLDIFREFQGRISPASAKANRIT